jgi:uncharacterized membrane protein YbhN (UPF0104 family)
MPRSSSALANPKKSFTGKIVLIAVALLLAALWLVRAHLSFDWPTLARQLRHVSLLYVSLAVAITYIGICLRAVRWAVLLAPMRKVASPELLSAQFIGFTLIALLGRITDLARPWLIARRTHTAFATQLAVYSIERGFDLGAAAILFSLALLFAPRNMPHYEAFARAGMASLAVTLAIAFFALTLRFTGDRVSAGAARLLRPLSPRLAASATQRILDFREGMRSISSLREFLTALALSLLLWAGIAAVYWCSARAFPASPQLAAFSVSATMLLLATAMGGSMLQLPVLGWFTQIAVLAAALRGFFAIPLEPATACAAVMLFTTTLCVAPTGIILARIEGIALSDAARSSSAATSH